MNTTIVIPNKKNVKIVAHRGYANLQTENTLNAFENSCKYSCWGEECDVHVTKDGKYVIFHDDYTGRVCDKNLLIEETSFEDIRNLKLRTFGSDNFDNDMMIPTLEEYLQVVKKYDKIAVIELKRRIEFPHIVKIIEICKELYDLNKIVFISFCFDNLLDVRKILPNQQIQFLCDRIDDELIEQLKLNKFDIDVYFCVLNEENAKKLKENNIKINVWTCDGLETANALIEMGVDFITSNILE